MASIEYTAFLAIAIATHALVGYVLGWFLFDRPIAGMVGALFADVDLLFPGGLGWPLVHRGLTHTLLVGGIASAAVAYRARRAGLAFGGGYLTQLLIDTTTPKGVPHLYPLLDTSFHLDLGTTGHSPGPTVAIWVCCLAVLWLLSQDRIDAPRL